MNDKVKAALAVLSATTVCASIIACGTHGKPPVSGNNGGGVTPLPPATDLASLEFTDNSESNDKPFNKELYYRNDLKLDMGDPMLVYDDGTFYAAGTRGGTSFEFFKSNDLTDWEQMDNNKSGFMPRATSWGTTSLWAPDIQKIGDKWYLYYTANYKNLDPIKKDENHCQIGVAVANKPYGPYTQWTGTNALGQKIGLSDLPFQGMEHKTVLDATVFQDDDGELYMYFSYDTQYDPDPSKVSCTAEIWGVHMLDPVTWDLNSLTRLIVAGYKTVDGANKNEIPWETWSPSFDEPMECAEGPYMLKRDGKYYLTYCANSFVDTEYAVGFAISDKPLGKYVKPDDTFLQNMICGVPGQTGMYINTRYLGFQTGTGHASICKVGEEYLLAFHAHYNRDKWGAKKDIYGEKSEWRALGVDYIYFGDDGMPYTNGPTYSLQRLPEAVCGYKNVALEGTVTVDGATGAECAFVNDNFTNRAFKTAEACRELQLAAGTHTVTVKLPRKMSVKAVNVYNSYDYSKRIDGISRIVFDGVGKVENIAFNKSYINEEQTFIFPHAAFNVELKKDAVTDTVTVMLQCDKPVALGEIEILAKAV